jgi:hypothetical protein
LPDDGSGSPSDCDRNTSGAGGSLVAFFSPEEGLSVIVNSLVNYDKYTA